MTDTNFLACFNETASFEGGFVDNPHDPGGATMAGVTQAVYTDWLEKQGRPNAPVKGISLGDRQAIYREFYWNAVSGDNLFDGLDLVVVDTGWGSGPVKAIEMLQQSLGVTADGKVGPHTLDVLKVHENSTDLINAVCNRRMAFFRGLSTWKYFGKGWTVRLNGIQGRALVMNAAALKPSAPIPSVKPAESGIPVAAVGDKPAAPATPSPAPVSPTDRVLELQHRMDAIGDMVQDKDALAPAHETLFQEIEERVEALFRKL